MITLPSLTIEATGCVHTTSTYYLGLCMELSNLAASQYTNYSFDSMCKFGDSYIAAGPEGIFTLDSGGIDGNGLDIGAIVEFCSTDFGASYQKRIRTVYVGYETDGVLKLVLSNDDENERVYFLSPVLTSQQSGKVPIDRDGKGRYWKLRIENVEGCDFSLDSVELVLVALARKPSGS